MKKINLKKYVSPKNAIFVLVLLVTIFLFGNYAAAGWEHGVIGGIIGLFISGITKILILLVNVLIVVASYSDFIHAEVVTKGWVVVRDICNMFFVVILLVIAFATILGQEEYSAKKNLPKLIMAAVLINFSKLFCGLMIDVANVVMLTFVNAFKEIGSGNIIDMLGISDILRYGQSGTAPTLSSTVSAYIFGLIYVLIATVVVASMLGMLVMRLVMMWIYIVLSPAAFFLQAVPGKGQQYASKWWSEWSSNLIVGPVLAFFLWLSFAALQTGGDPIPVSSTASTQNQAETTSYAVTDKGTSTESIDSKAGSVSGFAKFAIAIGMLLGGMKIAKEVGGETGSVLGTGMNAINKGKTMAIGAATGAAAWAAKGTGRLAKEGAARGSVGLVSKIGGESKVGKFAKGWGEDLKASYGKKRKEAAAGYLKKLGIGEKGSEAGKKLIPDQAFQNIANIAKGTMIGALGGAAVGTLTGGPVGTVAGFVGGAVAGYASHDKGKRVERIKKYDEYDKAKSNYDQAQSNYDGHDSFVKNYEENDRRATQLETEAKSRSLSTDEQKEYNERTDFHVDNGLKYDASKKYIANPDIQKSLRESKTDFTTKENAMNASGTYSKNQYDTDKKWVKNTGFLDRFSATKGAMEDLTKKQEASKKWVEGASVNTDTLGRAGKPGSLYSSSGLSDNMKNNFTQLAKGDPAALKAISNLIAEIKRTGPGALRDDRLKETAQAFAAFKKGGGTVDSGIETALKDKGHDPAAYEKDVFTSYKDFDETKMEHNPGTGVLQYDTFAKNATNHVEGKDIMGVSFDKVNSRAGKNVLDPKAGIHIQELSGTKLKEVSDAMSNLIDEEIATLQTVGAGITDEKIKQVNSNKIADLNTAKTRLKNGDVSRLSLKNTDMKPKGDNDSEKRRNDLNTTQHEIMHSAGATNETAVYAGADALQSAQLTGAIPNSGGQRYEVALGKMIAEMEKAEASQEQMSQAIVSQVEKWQVPNAQRVMETEKGLRDFSPAPAAEIKMEGLEKAINKLGSSLDRPTGADGKFIKLTPIDKDFFRRLSAKEVKVSSNVVEKLKPLGVMAANEEKRRNP